MKFFLKTFCLFVLVFSCSPKVEKNSISQECGNVNLLQDPVSQDRVVGLFKCKGWDQEYPELYKGIGEVDRAHWDALIDPFNKEVFNKSHERSKFIRSFKQLESKQAVANLANWMSMFLDFSPAFKRLFNCLNDEVCSNSHFTQSDIEDLVNDLDLNADHYLSISTLLGTLTNYFKKNKGYIDVIKSVWGNHYIEKKEVEFLDSFISELVKNENTEVLLNAFKNIFLQKDLEGNLIVQKIINSPTISTTKLRDFVSFFTANNKKFLKDVRALNEVTKESLSCKLEKSKSFLSKGLISEFDEIYTVLSSGTYEKFHALLVEKSILLTSIREICPWVGSLQRKVLWGGKEELHSISLLEMLKKTKELLADPDRYLIAKLMLNAWMSHSGDESTQEVLKSLSEDSTEKFADYSESVLNQHSAAADIVLDYVRSFKQEDYISLSHILDWTAKKDTSLLTLAKIWLFLEPEEKIHILKTTKFVLGVDVKAEELLSYFEENLKNLKDALPFIMKRFAKRDSFNSLVKSAEDFANVLGKHEFKEDFRKFLKDGHLVTFIHLISQNATYADLHQLKYDYLSEYYERNKISGFSFGKEQDASKAQVFNDEVDCINELSQQSMNFSKLVQAPPKPCLEVDGGNILIKIFKELHLASTQFSKEFPEKTTGHLFDDLGLVNKRSFSQGIALLKAIDSYKDDGYLRELISEFKFLLFDLKFNSNMNTLDHGALVADSFIGKIQEVFAKNEDKNLQEDWRNKLIYQASKQENFNMVGKALKPMSQVFEDFGKWKNSVSYQDFNDRKKPYDKKYACTNFQNTKLSPSICPQKQELKNRLNELLSLLGRVNDERGLSGAGELFEAASSGILIPYEGKDQRRKKLTLKETFRMVFDLTDETQSINSQTIPFRPIGTDHNNSNQEKMNTLERVETVIREVGFDENYLGANFKNGVTKGKDYAEAVEKKRALFKACIKLSFCGRWVLDDEKRMALNAISSIDSLIETSTVFGYGDYNQALLTIFVSSSWLEVQGGNIGDAFYKKEKLKRHNGIILTKLAELGSFVNIARVVRDRVGRTKKEFSDFINGKEFNIISKALFRGFELNSSKLMIKRLVQILSTVKNANSKTVSDELVDWVDELSYDDLRLAEETLASLLTISSYLGTIEQVGIGKVGVQKYSEFSNNNLFKPFMSAISVLELWKTLHALFPSKYEMIDFLKYVNNLLYFYKEGLLAQDNLAENPYYLTLNYFFKGLQAFYFDDFDSGTSALKIVLNMIKDKKINAEFYETFASVGSFFKTLEEHDKKNGKPLGDRYSNFGKFLNHLTESKLIDLSGLRDYLLLSTKKQICDSKGKCYRNFHFDEPMKLLRFLAKKESNQSRFYKLQNYVLRLESDSITDLMDRVLGNLQVIPN
jgi:hypothetical protein